MEKEPERVYPYDFARIVHSLWSDAPGSYEWLAESCARPGPFERALFAYAHGKSALKSESGTAYDFFQDFCVRHAASGRPALLVHGPSGVTTLSYRELETRTRTLRAHWHQAGVKRGDSVALICPFGVAYVTALFTALRMGLVITPILPKGRQYLANRLALLEPTHIFAGSGLDSWLAGYAARRLDAARQEREYQVLAADAPVYARDEVVLRLVSPHSTELAVVELSAHDVFCGALRDGTFVLDSGPGRALAWPDLDSELSQPALLFSALLPGGTYVHVEDGALEADPELSGRLSLDVLGVGVKLRDAVLSGRAKLPKVRALLRNPAEPFEWAPWDKFAQLAALDGMRCGSAVVTPCAGGTLLFSAKEKRPHLLRVLPAPGRPFQLVDTLGSGQVSETPSGVYAPLGPAQPELCAGRFLLSREGETYIFAGAIDGSPLGVPYPRLEVEQAVVGAGLAAAAGVLSYTISNRLNDASALLVVFVSVLSGELEAEDLGGLRSAIEQTLALECGRATLPRRIEILPLDERKLEGKLDRTWLASQWTNGLLLRKASHSVFRDLSRLRRIVAASVVATEEGIP